MNKYLVVVNSLCEKTVYIEAETEKMASELALEGKGLQLGYTPKERKILGVISIKETEMEV